MDTKKLIDYIASRDNTAEGDYMDAQGFLICGKCNTRKQCEIKILGATRRVPCLCKCRSEEIKTQKQREKRNRLQARINQLINEGVYESGFLDCTFDRDDKANPQISKVCRKYVANWDEMRAKNIGMLLYGDCGTGKSFYAYAIANALIGDAVPVCITSFPRLLNAMQGIDARQKMIDKLKNYDLLVLDDLGTERKSKEKEGYAEEQMFNIINTRYGIKKPLIVTTNLSMDDLTGVADLAHRRIFDRVLEICPIRLKLAGESRRAAIADKLCEEARNIFREAK